MRTRSDPDRGVFGGDRRLLDRGIGYNRGGDRALNDRGFHPHGGSGPAPIVPLTPDQVAGMFFWMKADAYSFPDGWNPNSIVESGPQGLTLNLGGSGRPTFFNNQVNGKPVFGFTQGYMGSANPVSLSQPDTIFVIAARAGFGTPTAMIDTYNPGARQLMYFDSTDHFGTATSTTGLVSPVATSTSEYNVYCAVFNGTSGKIYRDAILRNSGDSGTDAFNNNIVIGMLGDLTSWPFNGGIAEVVMYNSALAFDKIQGLQAGWAAKYGVPAP